MNNYKQLGKYSVCGMKGSEGILRTQSMKNPTNSKGLRIIQTNSLICRRESEGPDKQKQRRDCNLGLLVPSLLLFFPAGCATATNHLGFEAGRHPQKNLSSLMFSKNLP